MKAAGLSAHQVLAPLLLTAGLVSLFTFAFNERVVTRATETLKAWEAVDYGPIPTESGVRANVYLSDNGNILTAAYLAGAGEAIAMRIRSPWVSTAEMIPAIRTGKISDDPDAFCSCPTLRRLTPCWGRESGREVYVSAAQGAGRWGGAGASRLRSAKRDVVVLPRPVDAREGLLVHQAREAVASRNFLGNLHEHKVLVDLRGREAEERRELVLVGSHFAVARAERDAETEALGLDLLHAG